MDDSQAAALKRLEPDATLVYTTKFQNYFEYLFFHTRYRQKGLPVPQLAFDYKVYLWQPISRLLKIIAARLDYMVRHRRFPDSYESGYFKDELLAGRTGFLSLVGKKSFHGRFLKSKTDPIHYLIELQKETERPIYIIPHLMFFSKRPHRSTPSLIDILFGPEDKPGPIRRVVTLFKNPGKVFVEISQPVSLKHYLEAPEIKNQNTEYQSLMLRRDLLIQLNRHRQSITGPVLKSREELKESILTKDRFQEFMNHYSQTRSIPIQEVRKKADLYLEEIAASYSPSLIRVASSVVGWILRTMYDGVMVSTEGLNRVKSAALKGPLVLIPCHKSHIDYLILSYLLYHNNMPCPHIAAGKNLSFWPMGPIFRSGGAFFIRRSFRGAVLYARVFAEYIHRLLEEGYNIEQFIEGGRSRTGKLLMPKLGLLSILLDAFKNGACQDMIIVPIYIGYDRVIEESSYLHELEGGQKEQENLWQVIRARKFLKKRYGKIYIQFHDPISVNELLKQSDVSLQKMSRKEQNALCRNLGQRVINAINRVTVITPHALVASGILNGSSERFARSDLRSILEVYMSYLSAQQARLADTLVLDQARAIEQVLDSYTQRKFIELIPGPTDSDSDERSYSVNVNRRPYLEYYKNSCIASFIPAAMTALTILQKDAFQFSASGLHADYRFLQDFFQYEFAYDVDKSVEFYVRKTLKAFIDDAILMPHPTLPETYNVTSAGFRKLKLFSVFLKTYFESYWIVLSFYMRTPQDNITAKDRIKKIESWGKRMYKRREIERIEALSKVTYQNAVDLVTSRGIKGSENEEEIAIQADAIRRALKYLQPQ